mmetsp:Transcript_27537/g.55102  ORF Transcript_27537/g.55102 Transcript_27537/m.55102 type:complete len:207 (+) Transcript_27537:2281-2901(+)
MACIHVRALQNNVMRTGPAPEFHRRRATVGGTPFDPGQESEIGRLGPIGVGAVEGIARPATHPVGTPFYTAKSEAATDPRVRAEGQIIRVTAGTCGGGVSQPLQILEARVIFVFDRMGIADVLPHGPESHGGRGSGRSGGTCGRGRGSESRSGRSGGTRARGSGRRTRALAQAGAAREATTFFALGRIDARFLAPFGSELDPAAAF